MGQQVDLKEAVKFLSYIFGEKPNGYILSRRMHPRATKDNENAPDYNKLSHWDTPDKPASSPTWQDEASRWNVYFSTATAKTKEVRSAKNTQELPALFFDIDVGKDWETVSSAIKTEFIWEELEADKTVSTLVRSSKGGIHGYLKMSEPFHIDGSKTEFDTHIKPLLFAIAYYYGGDFSATDIGRFLRIPGTFNHKYSTPFPITARYYDREHTLEGIRKKFKIDLTVVPLPVWFGISTLSSPVFEESGMRHQFFLGLAGTVRKSGMDRESCKALLKKVAQWHNYSDISTELEGVDSTYDFESGNPEVKIATLFSEFPEIASKIESICDAWVKYKSKFAKKLRLPWKPDNYDPRTDPVKPSGEFWVEADNTTWYYAKEKDDAVPRQFCNFSLTFKGKLYEPETKKRIAIYDVKVENESDITTIEVSTSHQNSYQSFSKIERLPPNMTCLVPMMWNTYISWLNKNTDGVYSKVKTSHYGWFDVPSGNPTLVFPSFDHPLYKYIDTYGADNCVNPDKCATPLSNEKKIEYLQGFATNYPHYHEPKYIYPALGWFIASFVAEFLRNHGMKSNIPTLFIRGIMGSGKSTLIEKVFVRHLGLEDPKIAGQTTPFFLAKSLSSSNMFPTIIEEFRNEDERKVGMYAEIIRSLWNGQAKGFGVGDGKVRKEKLISSVCILGEHLFADPAVNERLFVITLDKVWVDKINKLTVAEKQWYTDRQEWFDDDSHKCVLSSIILEWLQDNVDLIPIIIDKAIDLVHSTTPIKNTQSRKNHGIVGVVTGLLIFNQIYRDHNLNFFLKKQAMLDALYSADNMIADYNTSDTDAMRVLFNKTDFEITKAVSGKRSLDGLVYHFDHETNLIHFHITRWHGIIAESVRRTHAASLTELRAFKELLYNNARDSESVIHSFDSSPLFGKGSVAIDTQKLSEQYEISVRQWKNQEDLIDEMDGGF